MMIRAYIQKELLYMLSGLIRILIDLIADHEQ